MERRGNAVNPADSRHGTSCLPTSVRSVTHERRAREDDAAAWLSMTASTRRDSHRAATTTTTTSKSTTTTSRASESDDLFEWTHALCGFKPAKLRTQANARVRAKALAAVRVRDATGRDDGRVVWVCLAQLINGDGMTQELRAVLPGGVRERFLLCQRALASCEFADVDSTPSNGPPWSRKRAMYGFLIEQWHGRADFLITGVECTEDARGMAGNYTFSVIWDDGAASRLTWNDFKAVQMRIFSEERERKFISLLKPAVERKIKVEDASPGIVATDALYERIDVGALTDDDAGTDTATVAGTEDEEHQRSVVSDAELKVYANQNTMPCSQQTVKTMRVKPARIDSADAQMGRDAIVVAAQCGSNSPTSLIDDAVADNDDDDDGTRCTQEEINTGGMSNAQLNIQWGATSTRTLQAKPRAILHYRDISSTSEIAIQTLEDEKQRIAAAVAAAERHAADLKARVEEAEVALARHIACVPKKTSIPTAKEPIVSTKPTSAGTKAVKQPKRKWQRFNDDDARHAKLKPKPHSEKKPGEVGPFYNCLSFVEMSQTARDNADDDADEEHARVDKRDLQMLHEFVDFSLEEIDFMVLWNIIARRFQVLTSDDVPALCKSFAKFYSEKLLKDADFYEKFVIALTNLFDSGIINRVDVVDVLRFAKQTLPVGKRPPKPKIKRDYVL